MSNKHSKASLNHYLYDLTSDLMQAMTFSARSFLFKKVDRISTATEIIKNIKAVEDMSEDMLKFHNLNISNSFKTLRNRE